MGNKTFTFGDIRIRELNGKYYLCTIENDLSGKRRDHYVGPLADVVETYEKVKEDSSGGLRRYSLRGCRHGDLNPGQPGLQPGALPG